jgi:hypothetical protein
MAYRVGTPGPPWRRELVADFTLSAASAGALWIGSVDLLASGDAALAIAASRIAFPLVALALGILVLDLGRPRRFHHMVLAFNPTSPMSWGVYILSAYAFVAFAAFFFPEHRLLALAAAVLAPAVLAYKGLLLSATAVRFWRRGRLFGPLLLAAGVALGAGVLAFAAPDDARLGTVLGTASLLQAGLVSAVWQGASGEESALRGANLFLFWAGGAGSAALATLAFAAGLDLRVAGALAIAGGIALRWALLRGPVEGARS